MAKDSNDDVIDVVQGPDGTYAPEKSSDTKPDEALSILVALGIGLAAFVALIVVIFILWLLWEVAKAAFHFCVAVFFLPMSFLGGHLSLTTVQMSLLFFGSTFAIAVLDNKLSKKPNTGAVLGIALCAYIFLWICGFIQWLFF